MNDQLSIHNYSESKPSNEPLPAASLMPMTSVTPTVSISLPPGLNAEQQVRALTLKFCFKRIDSAN